MRELLEQVNRIANVLVGDLGLVPGNRVLLRAPNNPMMVAAYLAVIKAGGIVVATMPLLRARARLPDREGADPPGAVRRAARRRMEKAAPSRPVLKRVVYLGQRRRRGASKR